MFRCRAWDPALCCDPPGDSTDEGCALVVVWPHLDGGLTGVLLSWWNILISVLCFFFFFLVSVCVHVFTIEDKKSKDQAMETWMGSSGPLLKTLRRHKKRCGPGADVCCSPLR